MATKSVQRTLEYLRGMGHCAVVVEKFNAFAGPLGHREDLFGFIDILTLSDSYGILGVQACGEDWGSHVTKITQDRKDIVHRWLESGGCAMLIGWRKIKMIKADGTKGKAERWTPRIGIITEGPVAGSVMVSEIRPETGYICSKCATDKGAVWPEGHCATAHTGLCPECHGFASLCSVGDWNWPRDSKRPLISAGRD